MQPFIRTYISAIGTIRVDDVRYSHRKLREHCGRIVEIWGRQPVEVYLAGGTSEEPLVVLTRSDRTA